MRSLIDGLDAEWSGAAAACVALDGLLPSVTASSDFIRAVLSALLHVLPRIEHVMTRNGALTVGCSLAITDVDGVMGALLDLPTPLGSAPTQLMQRLAREPSVLGRMLHALLKGAADASLPTGSSHSQTLSGSSHAQLPSGTTDPAAKATAALAAARACTATALLTALAEGDPAPLTEHRPAILAAIVLRLGATKALGGRSEAAAHRAAAAFLGTLEEPLTVAPDPRAVSSTVTPSAVSSADTSAVSSAVTGAVSSASSLALDFGGELELHAVQAEVHAEVHAELLAPPDLLEPDPLEHASLAAALASGRLESALGARSFVHVALRVGCAARPVFEHLEAHKSSLSDGQRHATISAIGQLMSVTRDDPTLAKQGLATLLRAADDATADMRAAALHGLRRLGEVGVLCTHLRAEVPALLTRLSASLGDPTPLVVLAAFRALMPVLGAAAPSAIVAVLPVLTEHSRAAAEHDAEASASAADLVAASRMRAAGFEVFAWLTRAAGATHQADCLLHRADCLTHQADCLTHQAGAPPVRLRPSSRAPPHANAHHGATSPLSPQVRLRPSSSVPPLRSTRR